MKMEEQISEIVEELWPRMVEALRLKDCQLKYASSDIEELRELYEKTKSKGYTLRSKTGKFDDLKSELEFLLRFEDGQKADFFKSVFKLDLEDMREEYANLESQGITLDKEELLVAYLTATSAGFGSTYRKFKSVEKFFKETGLIEYIPLEARIEEKDVRVETDKGYVMYKGPISDVYFESKFILVEDEVGFKVLADKTEDFHRGVKMSHGIDDSLHGVDVKGGGRIVISNLLKQIMVLDVSKEYGMEDRSETIEILRKAFPDYRVS